MDEMPSPSTGDPADPGGEVYIMHEPSDKKHSLENMPDELLGDEGNPRKSPRQRKKAKIGHDTNATPGIDNDTTRHPHNTPLYFPGLPSISTSGSIPGLGQQPESFNPFFSRQQPQAGHQQYYTTPQQFQANPQPYYTMHLQAQDLYQQPQTQPYNPTMHPYEEYPQLQYSPQQPEAAFPGSNMPSPSVDGLQQEDSRVFYTPPPSTLSLPHGATTYAAYSVMPQHQNHAPRPTSAQPAYDGYAGPAQLRRSPSTPAYSGFQMQSPFSQYQAFGGGSAINNSPGAYGYANADFNGSEAMHSMVPSREPFSPLSGYGNPPSNNLQYSTLNMGMPGRPSSTGPPTAHLQDPAPRQARVGQPGTRRSRGTRRGRDPELQSPRSLQDPQLNYLQPQMQIPRPGLPQGSFNVGSASVSGYGRLQIDSALPPNRGGNDQLSPNQSYGVPTTRNDTLTGTRRSGPRGNKATITATKGPGPSAIGSQAPSHKYEPNWVFDWASKHPRAGNDEDLGGKLDPALSKFVHAREVFLGSPTLSFRDYFKLIDAMNALRRSDDAQNDGSEDDGLFVESDEEDANYSDNMQQHPLKLQWLMEFMSLRGQSLDPSQNEAGPSTRKKRPASLKHEPYSRVKTPGGATLDVNLYKCSKVARIKKSVQKQPAATPHFFSVFQQLMLAHGLAKQGIKGPYVISSTWIVDILVDEPEKCVRAIAELSGNDSIKKWIPHMATNKFLDMASMPRMIDMLVVIRMQNRKL
jgi:hypothetical protein